MKAVLRLSLVFIILSVAASIQVASYCLDSEEEVRRKLLTAFEAVSEAERAGGDVSRLIDDLREALNLIDGRGEDDLELAESIVDSVLKEAPAVSAEGVASTRIDLMWTGVVVGLVSVGAILVWRFGPRVFWSFWLRSKSDWRVCS